MFLILHKIEEGLGTMGGENNDTIVEYNLPIDLLGPFEVHDKGTLIHLRNSMGYVIIKESTEEVRSVIAKILSSGVMDG